ncbi:unnamed protein product [Lasius platythorax]|uniref:Uncharacterized protein n=1 Tax=Lasius platythorax TaxID=488582 RepID=A0AAV2MZA5_9HYME
MVIGGSNEFKCDILDVLENEDRSNSLLEKLISSCREFRLCVAAKIEKRLLYEEDCTNKKSATAAKISELQQKIDTVTANMDIIT